MDLDIMTIAADHDTDVMVGGGDKIRKRVDALFVWATHPDISWSNIEELVEWIDSFSLP